MKFCQETVSDLKKYYQGSFVKFPEAGEMLHMVEDVRSDRLRGKRWAISEESGEYEEQPFEFLLHRDDEHTPCIEYVMPVKSYFNHGGHAWLLARSPARQYRRGVTSENTVIQMLESNGTFDGYNPSFERLESYVQKKHFEGFHKITGGSYAVAPRIAIAANGSVFVDRVKVGTINYDKSTVYLGSPLFVAEIEAVITATSSAFVVEVAAQAKKRTRRGVIKDPQSGDFVYADIEEDE